MVEELGDLVGRIAIVGMAGRFPGARTLDEFWRNLRQGVESVRFLSREEVAAAGVPAALADDPDWVPAVSMPEGIDEFDAPFFGISHREAELLDPQQRLFLELCWAALEDAGRAPGTDGARTAVYAGVTTSTYMLYNLARSSQVLATVDPLQLIIGNAVDSLATRVSYKLDLKGASHAVQCACSTSLVTVHLACQALIDQECDLALAGGVSLNVSLRGGYRFQPGSILSPDGHCRAFDEAAQGTIFGGGGGVVVLKRLEDALADRDTVRAVILGSAVNNDGAAKVGYTAPSVEGQAAVIAEALSVAGAGGGARQLPRPRRRLPARHPPDGPAARGARGRSGDGPPVRGPHGGRGGRRGRGGAGGVGGEGRARPAAGGDRRDVGRGARRRARRGRASWLTEEIERQLAITEGEESFAG